MFADKRVSQCSVCGLSEIVPWHTGHFTCAPCNKKKVKVKAAPKPKYDATYADRVHDTTLYYISQGYSEVQAQKMALEEEPPRVD